MSSEVMARLGGLREAVDDTLQVLDDQDFAARTWKKDPSLWKNDTASQKKIVERLGWLDLPKTMLANAADLVALANELRAEGYRHVVLLGTGGSSLGSKILRRVFGKVEDYPELLTVDTTDPGFILQTERTVHLAKTIFIVNSKSGVTTEPNVLMRYYYDKVKSLKGNQARENFIAITDPGTTLEKFARENNFREVFLNPPDVGGRYSVLSYFGLVPAALAGYDIREMLMRAAGLAEECHKPGSDNPGLHLGAILGTAALKGCDKATLIVPEVIESFGMWAEQLISASTGKEGRGIIPIIGEKLGEPGVYGSDRLFVILTVEGHKNGLIEERCRQLEEAKQPVVRLSLKDPYDITAEFFRWEYAVAVAGAVLNLNPFDEPQVAESKENTQRVLEGFVKNGVLPQLDLVSQPDSFGVTRVGEASSVEEALSNFVKQIKPDDYLAFLAYVTPDAANEAVLQETRVMARDKLKVATSVSYGPRFLHAIGQLHKGGPNSLIAIQLIGADPEDVTIPGAPYTFSVLKQAQALGDFEALQKHGRRVISVQLNVGGEAGLKQFKEALKVALSLL